jgi:glycosyltransferase involved in cell wall biosynthesis
VIAAVDGSIFHLQGRGGISRIYHEILPRMADLDPSLEIHLLLSDDARQQIPSHSRIALHHLPIERVLPHNRLFQNLISGLESIYIRLLFRRTKRVIWHPTYYGNAFGWRGPRVALVADMIHEILPDLFTSREEIRFRRRKRRCIVDADAVICISKATRDDVLRFIPEVDPERLFVVHLAHSEVFSSAPDQAASEAPGDEKPFVLTFGSNNTYKGFADLLQAYRQWDRREAFDLGVVGEGPFDQGSGQPGHVRAFGVVSDSVLRDLYHRASAFIYPSRYEGFGIPLLEAMACGCPVTASRIPATIEVAGDIPIYFEPGDRQSMIDALTRCVVLGRDSPAISRGLKRVRRFTWDRAAKQILEVYRSLI